MESNPAEEQEVEIELYTPSDISYSKTHNEETTPKDEHGKLIESSLPRPNKVAPGERTKTLKEKGHKLSKRKLFPGQSITATASGNESAYGSLVKKKKCDDAVKGIGSDCKNETGSLTVKVPLTERQQLAFLLEVTGMQTNSDGVEGLESLEKETFTKVRTRNGTKKRKSAINPRVCRRNERGETPLHITAIKGDVAGIKKLIKDGAEVGVKDYAGWTALHEACNHGNLLAVQVLLDHGAAVNVPGFEGDTPLHDAVINNHVEVVDTLLSFEANPQQTNSKLATPIDLINSKEMYEVFASHGIQLPTWHHSMSLSGLLEIPETNKNKAVVHGDCNSSLLSEGELPTEQDREETKAEHRVMTENRCCENKIPDLSKAKIVDVRGEHCTEARITTIEIQTEEAEVTSKTTPGSLRENKTPEPKKAVVVSGHKEFHNKSSILGNEIQRKQTQGESKMEKPVMYVCKLAPGEWSEEITVRTTQMNPVCPEEPDDGEAVASKSAGTNMSEAKVESPLVSEAESFHRDHEQDVDVVSQTGGKSIEGISERSAEALCVKNGSEKHVCNQMDLDEQLILWRTDSVHKKQTTLNEEAAVEQNSDSGQDFEEQISDQGQPSTQLSAEESFSCDQNTMPGVLKKDEDVTLTCHTMGEAEGNDSRSVKERTADRDATLRGITTSLPKPLELPKTDVSSVEKLIAKTEFSPGLQDEWEAITGVNHDDQRLVSKLVPVLDRAECSIPGGTARHDGPQSSTIPKQEEFYQLNKMRKAVPAGNQSRDERQNGFIKGKEGEIVPGCSATVSKPKKPPVTWRSLMGRGRCNLTELRIPNYDQFLMNTKNYQLANGGAVFEQNNVVQPSELRKEKEKLFLKQERSKQDLIRKQNSEKDKLQICMEQEIVRFYARNAYSSLKCSPPPGVCAALCWQSMAPQQLKIEKKKPTQKRFEELNKILPTGHGEIVDKYDKLKKLMCLRHKHEQQALDAVIKLEMQPV